MRLTTFFLFFLFSCSGPQNIVLNQFTELNDNFSISNFTKIGFKISEKYDNSDLPYSYSVYRGFWKDKDADEGSARFQSLGGSVGGMRDYEIRFYENYEQAQKFGQKYADNATGENAVLTKKKSLWPTGIKNRRTSGGPDGSPLPKYGGYVIYANFILLCEGVNLDQSLKTCSKIIQEINEN
jgi:hypothetical protein